MAKFYWYVNFEELREETYHRVNIFTTFMKKRIQQDATIYQNFIIPNLYKTQHV
jgi:hypothetical protein